MFIPKSKMKILIHAIDTSIQYGGFTAEEKDLLNQVVDRAALCANGDAPWLEIEVCYANKPE